MPKVTQEHRSKMYKSRMNVEHKFYEPIYPDYGVAKMLAEEYGLVQSTIHKYLQGSFTGFKEEQVKLATEIREKARQMTTGKYYFVARDRNGELNCFKYMPRKDDNIWYDPIQHDDRRMFPEDFLPPGANPQWADRYPTRIQIINSPALR